MSKSTILYSTILLTLVLGFLFHRYSSFLPETPNGDQKKIALILPTFHQALEEIKNGFIEELGAEYQVDVYNAMGQNTQLLNIIDQLSMQNYAFVAGVGASTTVTLKKRLNTQNIVGIAASLPPVDQESLLLIDDEIPKALLLEKLKPFLPHPKAKIYLVYSNADKIHQEKNTLIAAAHKQNLNLHELMINQTHDLSRIDTFLTDAEVIIVLKDHMVVAGMGGLAKIAQKINIPLIAADDGSVKNGADIAIGVKEKSIGEKAAQILKEGHKKGSFLVEPHYLFINSNSPFYKKNDSLQELAQEAGLKMQFIEG